MSDSIIIYPKGSDYPKVTKEDLQKANYISVVINASDIDGAVEQLQMVHKLTVDSPDSIAN